MFTVVWYIIGEAWIELYYDNIESLMKDREELVTSYWIADVYCELIYKASTGTNSQISYTIEKSLLKLKKQRETVY